MTEQILSCPDCDTGYELGDNYCRECGMYVGSARPMPVVRVSTSSVALDRPRAQLPTPVKRAVTAVALGAALQMSVSLAGRYLAGQAGKKAATAALKSARSRNQPARRTDEAAPLSNVSAVTETVIVQRTWFRR